jgi:hypothetical protein
MTQEKRIINALDEIASTIHQSVEIGGSKRSTASAATGLGAGGTAGGTAAGAAGPSAAGGAGIRAGTRRQSAKLSPTTVGRCRLPVSKPELQAFLLSALENKVS